MAVTETIETQCVSRFYKYILLQLVFVHIKMLSPPAYPDHNTQYLEGVPRPCSMPGYERSSADQIGRAHV